MIEGLKQERTRTDEQQLSLFEVNPQIDQAKHLLLIPVYKPSTEPLAKVRSLAKFEVERSEFEVFKRFVQATDDRVLLALTEKDPHLLALLRSSLHNPDTFYRYDGRRQGDLRRLLGRVLDYLGVAPEEVEGLKKLEDEIRHFRHITVSLADIDDLSEKVNSVKRYPEMKRELREMYGKIPPEEYVEKDRKISSSQEFVDNGKPIIIKHIAQHYYLPVVLAEDERVDYIRHIIKTPSEVEFIKDLEQYLGQPTNKFKDFDWWFFSKLDESLDEIYIPYYDPKTNRIARFKPDFIFWLVKGERYFIVFVDPKGTEHAEALRKVDGYKAVFTENKNLKKFQCGNYKATVHLFLYNEKSAGPEHYAEFWVNSTERLLESLLTLDR